MPQLRPDTAKNKITKINIKQKKVSLYQTAVGSELKLVGIQIPGVFGSEVY